METLPQDFLELAEELTSRADNGPTLKLKEALLDYNNVCEQLKEEGLSPVDQGQWNETRRELEAELNRLVIRLRPEHQ